jgi:hypothetical protein
MSDSSSKTPQTDQLALGVSYLSWRESLSSGVHALQAELVESEAKTTTQRGFVPVAIPGLLQTPEYARRVFENNATFGEVPATVDEAVRLRMQRQEVLNAPEKSFHIVMTEAPLHYCLVPSQAMLPQLEKLIVASALPTLRLGIIPFKAMPLGGIPYNGFWIEEERFVAVETFSGELQLTQPDDIALYAKVFDQMATAAVYDNEARQLISRIALASTP